MSGFNLPPGVSLRDIEDAQTEGDDHLRASAGAAATLANELRLAVEDAHCQASGALELLYYEALEMACALEKRLQTLAQFAKDDR